MLAKSLTSRSKSTFVMSNRSGSATSSKIVGYWRKANAIHRWFVENVQEDVDNCSTYWVSDDKLTRLLHLVNQVLSDHSKAAKLLPTHAGFFFGSTDYEKCYFENLKAAPNKTRSARQDSGTGRLKKKRLPLFGRDSTQMRPA